MMCSSHPGRVFLAPGDDFFDGKVLVPVAFIHFLEGPPTCTQIHTQEHEVRLEHPQQQHDQCACYDVTHRWANLEFNSNQGDHEVGDPEEVKHDEWTG